MAINSFEPISSGIMSAAGMGFQLYGMSQTNAAAKEYNTAQVQQIELERKAEAQRRQLMELDANRRQMEVLRNNQRTRALGLASATNQGAQFGSGLQGGYGQARGAAGNNMLGINQNLQIGRNIFDINSKISDTKISQANAQMHMQEGQAWSSFGGNMMNSAGPFGKLASGFGMSPDSGLPQMPGFNSWGGPYT